MDHTNLILCFLFYFLDERDKVQKKTFTKWINQHLMKVSYSLTPRRCFPPGRVVDGAHCQCMSTARAFEARVLSGVRLVGNDGGGGTLSAPDHSIFHDISKTSCY